MWASLAVRATTCQELVGYSPLAAISRKGKRNTPDIKPRSGRNMQGGGSKPQSPSEAAAAAFWKTNYSNKASPNRCPTTFDPTAIYQSVLRRWKQHHSFVPRARGSSATCCDDTDHPGYYSEGPLAFVSFQLRNCNTDRELRTTFTAWNEQFQVGCSPWGIGIICFFRGFVLSLGSCCKLAWDAAIYNK